jgi:NAD(P)H-hydrate repair Nnr-like enzyme with NAD(P)H-hydrate dehydratase domain
MSPDLPRFIRQDGDLLFPKVLYNRPVTRSGAGRLLLVGGHSGEFSLPTTIYQLAMAAGLGDCQVALPDSLLRFIGGLPGTNFVPSSPSGSLGTEALGRILEISEEMDAVAIGASLSNNSHTAILVERLIQEVGRPVVLFGDALPALAHHTGVYTQNPDCLVILTMPELFKIAGQLHVPITIRRDGGLINKLEIVRDVAAASACQYVVYGTEIIIADAKESIVTPVNYRLGLLPAAYYAVLATMWLQNPSKRREGLATGAYLLRELSAGLTTNAQPAVTDLAIKLGHLLDLAG